MAGSAAIITVSDGVMLGHREDVSGETADRVLAEAGFEPRQREHVPDEKHAIEAALWRCAADDIDLVVTTGGTGFGPRDVTPEATRSVIEREAPGLAELMRSEGTKKTPMAALSRGIAGTCRQTLIVNLPGSPKGVEESLGALLPLLPHAIETMRGHTEHS